jgi:hypothetical protein
MRTRHDVLTSIVKTLKEGVLLLILILGTLLVWNTSVLSESIVREATVVERLEETWLSCLNNGAVYIGGELHICKAVNTGLGKKHLEDAK